MCFSASASFGVGGFLALAAIIAQIKARSRGMQIFGLIPAVFAMQQIAEGFLWYLENTSIWYKPMAYIFLIGAASWPFFIPGALWNLEKNGERKKLLAWLAMLGALFFISTLLVMYWYGATAKISGNHIVYRFNYLNNEAYDWLRYIYVALVALPPFLSTVKKMWLFGIGVLATFIFAHIWYATHFTSIWCFFAAILSSLVLYIILSE